MKMNHLILSVLVWLAVAMAVALPVRGDDPKPVPSTSWRLVEPLGLREPAAFDTLTYNIFQQYVPSAYSPAFAITGNQTSEAINMVYMDREPMSRFFFNDAKSFWLPSAQKVRFYNTAIPMSQLSYTTGGGREIAQDWFRFLFSGNISPKAQIAVNFSYPYSKGSYNNQASKGIIWGLEGSYLGDRYEMQAFVNAYNMINKENGGITDDLYIIDPAKLQGGISKINPRTIPTNLNAAHSRIRAGQKFVVK